MIKSADLENAIDVMVDYMIAEMRAGDPWMMVGIADGGVPVRNRLQKVIRSRIGRELPSGTLNVSFHRDDIGHRPISKVAEPTYLEESVDDMGVFLIDDVFFTGRTVRSALDELFELGRPRVVRLMTVVDRGHRVLPIRPDFVGLSLDTDLTQTLKLHIDPDDPERHRLDISGKLSAAQAR